MNLFIALIITGCLNIPLSDKYFHKIYDQENLTPHTVDPFIREYAVNQNNQYPFLSIYGLNPDSIRVFPTSQNVFPDQGLMVWEYLLEPNHSGDYRVVLHPQSHRFYVVDRDDRFPDIGNDVKDDSLLSEFLSLRQTAPIHMHGVGKNGFNLL
ncbi:MAG: hypothetical protein SF052_07635 [Bacteroidia bacterium]|nr:hypothetical protein [Bacteroidia bacterium]